jgi:Na+-transporting NADH:ubiquinone oxidoreductase subunit NqrB
MRWDPRLYQIATLTGLLAYGVGWLGLDVDPPIAITILLTVLATQLVAARLTGHGRFDPRSALISGLSLCLLLRTSSPTLAALTAVVAIASKVLVRVGPKHVFNPTNGALVLMLLLTGGVWVSPGQWGSAATFAFFLAAAGALVVSRAARADVTWTFLAAHAALVIGRALWLGDPLEIPLHRLANGALVLFAFFMISDPRTTPDSRLGRFIFAVAIAASAHWLAFFMQMRPALYVALVALSPFILLLDKILPAERFSWTAAAAQGASR